MSEEFPHVRRSGPQLIPSPETARPVDSPDWLSSEAAVLLTLDDVRAAFGGRVGRKRPRSLPDPASLPDDLDRPPDIRGNSAVAVILNPGPSGLEVVLTRRAWHMRSHSGEISFPGGGVEEQDADIATTALRETHEEVGIDPALVTVVGQLDHLSTISSERSIVPVVCTMPERPWVRADPKEVDSILHVSLAELASETVHSAELWGTSPVWEMHFFELDGNTVWGATAAMLHQLLQLLLAPNSAT